MDVHPYLRWDGPIAFAHRGGTGHAPENTMAAFEHAVSRGYRYLETDVHRTADGVLAAFHDSNLLRTCGVDAEIANLTWNEIAELRVDGSEPIPKMVDLLQRWPNHRFNIDCKSDAALPALVAIAQEFDLLDRICVGSFSLRRLRRLRSALGSRLLTSMSPSEIGMLRCVGRLPGLHQRAAQVPPAAGRLTVVNERFLRSSRAAGIPVHVWTINDAIEMERLLDLGVDGIMTDDVELLRSVLIDRDVWQE